ncbi:unnamed protein product, partial [marine sediment metagenome]
RYFQKETTILLTKLLKPPFAGDLAEYVSTLPRICYKLYKYSLNAKL